MEDMQYVLVDRAASYRLEGSHNHLAEVARVSDQRSHHVRKWPVAELDRN